MNSVRALLGGLIDYAGLFPPASLDMSAAVHNYAAYLDGENAWMLGRFILPSARIAEFASAAKGIRSAWSLSLLAAERFEMPPALACSVASVEKKVERPEDIHEAGLTIYYEIPRIREAAPFLEVLSKTGGRAKIRTGGLSEEMFPASPDLARFLALSAAANVPFKATAGLHHPIRSRHRFTYEAGSAEGVMHGFLNVFLAAALVYCAGNEDYAIKTLEETSPGAFRFDDHGVSWHTRRLSTEQLRAARENFAISFGSCSFEEPVADLKALGLL